MEKKVYSSSFNPVGDFMQHSSLKTKILSILLTFTVINTGLVSFIAWEYWQQYDSAHISKINNIFYISATKFIHELQKERGKSSFFLAKNISLSELNDQKASTDQTFSQVKNDIINSSIDRKLKDKISELTENLQLLRSQVSDSKIIPAESAQKYTAIIAELLKLQIATARVSTASGVEKRLLSMCMLETAKENAGRLRAFLTGIIATNQPIDKEKIKILTFYKSGIEANLFSEILSVSDDGTKSLQKFTELPSWKKSVDIYQHVISKSDEGNFGVDNKEYFKNISESIENIYKIVISEESLISENVQLLEASSKQKLAVLLSIGLFLTVSLIFVATRLVNNINKSLSNAVSSLSNTSEIVLSTSNLLKSSSQTISDQSSSTAAALEETVASVTEMNSQVDKNSEAAGIAVDLSSNSKKIAQAGEVEIKSLIHAITEISNASSEIGDIINVIDDIAFQTNLLALNAAVEAARAGELGKGFAVVADAVRALAQKSADATKNIQALIVNTQEKVLNGSEIATKSEKALSEILTSTNKTADIIVEMATATKEQAYGLSQISKAMNQIDQSTQSSAATAEETASSAESLMEQSATLNNLVIELQKVVYGKAS